MRLNRLSLQWKLPLLIAALSAMSVAAFGVVSFRQVRAAELHATHTRFLSALGEISAIVALGAVNQMNSLKVTASNPVIHQVLTSSDRVDSAAITVMNALSKESGSVAAVELLDSKGAIRYRGGTDTLPSSNSAQTHYATIGEIFQRDSALYFWCTAPAYAGDRLLGVVRVGRKIGGSANNRIVTRLLGQNAVLLIGNGDGRYWSSGRPVTLGPLDSSLATYVRDNSVRVATSIPLKDTPWRYAIELPEADATIRAHELVLPFLVSGLFIALLSGLLGLFLSRTITAPLRELTEASEGIARGDRTVVLNSSLRHDEIGRLARAFGAMALQIRGIVERLEASVDERSGELSAAVRRLRDVDDQLQQNVRLASLGRAFGSIGHELRNPLSVMSNVVWLLNALPDASPKLAEYSRLLREQLRLSERIITDLLDHARSGDATFSPTDVAQLLDDALQRAALPSHIRVVRDIDPHLPAVMLDQDRVGQVVWNLIRNAVQAIDDQDGVLTVAAHIVDARLRIEIRDTGPGVQPHDVEHIFQPLFTTKAEGVGLGLSISRDYAKAHGGDLSVVTGQGGCFVLELPLEAGKTLVRNAAE